MAKKLFFLSILLFSLLAYSCTSSPKANKEEQIALEEQKDNLIEEEPTDPQNQKINDELVCIFAGDVMAHAPNFQMKDFSKIWKYIKDVTLSADLSFANIEAPVDDSKDWSTYPSFNMHTPYLKACIDAGFNTFSLSNNHTNDQYASGILGTMKTVEKLKAEYKEKNIDLNFSGIRQKNQDFTYSYFEKNGWKILFCAMTELLNRPNDKEYVNFVPPKTSDRQAYAKYIKELRETHPCDLFVVSVHTAEPEYTRKVTDAQDEFYDLLLASGADVVWANHAHIIKDRKAFGDETGRLRKLIMYANGNTISAQRTSPNFNLKMTERDDTGDGLLYRVVYAKDENGNIYIKNAKNIFITTYINTAGEYVIRKLDNSLIDLLLDPPARQDWAKYIEKRIQINSSATKELLEWQ
ncbi:MAG: CapA family protein [Treponema sp.]|nr:CapA family protein [Treponema sp.]